MKFLFAVSALAALTFAADVTLAADVPVVYAPPPQLVAAPFVVWTGCSIGINGGGAASRTELSELSPGPSSSGGVSEQAVAGGGQVGCDYQFGSMVAGVQGMFDGMSFHDGTLVQFPGTVGTAHFFGEPWFGTFSGRIGYAVDPSVLLYIKGGGAWMPEQNTGWNIGGGLEWKFNPNFSIFVEYDFMRPGVKGVSFDINPTVSANYSVILQSILVGLNWRFDWGPFVTTRY